MQRIRLGIDSRLALAFISGREEPEAVYVIHLDRGAGGLTPRRITTRQSLDPDWSP